MNKNEFSTQDPFDRTSIKAEKLPQHCSTPESSYESVRSMNTHGNKCRLDLGSFITTHADNFATRIMAENSGLNYACPGNENSVKNISSKCIGYLSGLWNRKEHTCGNGLATSGSSEGGMIAGVAAWLRWREQRIKLGKSVDRPNFVISSLRHVCWDRFSFLWQIEMRTVPVSEEGIDITAAIKLCDENTIMVVALAGDSYTGSVDEIEGLDMGLSKFNRSNKLSVPIHVDAAIGGFILPFLYPAMKWDFRLPNVISINTSAHKFGLVYPGLGWLLWRDDNVAQFGDRSLDFTFSNTRPSSQVLCQYYQFLRLGFEGYRAVMNSCMDTAVYACRRISSLGPFEILNQSMRLPMLAFRMVPDYVQASGWSMGELNNSLKKEGWVVHLITLPETGDKIMRVVFRRGMSCNLVDRLVMDLEEIIKQFEDLNSEKRYG